MKGETRGVALQGINVGDFRRLPMAMPPLVEQRRIVVELDKHLSVVDACEATRAGSAVRSSRLRQSILKWAFEGKLVDQDPNDEPALVLLDRIKAERAAMEAQKKANKRSSRRKK